MPEIELFIRDSSLDRIAQVSIYNQLEAISRWNDVGTWILDLPYNSSLDDMLTLDNGIVLYVDGEVEYSGEITGKRREKADGVNKITLNGFDDNVWLDRRLAMPQPSTAAPPYSVSAYDQRTGVVSTIMRQYVDYNGGGSGLVARAIPNLSLAADPVLGTAGTKGRARYQKLLAFLQRLANINGLGFKVQQSGNNLEFSIFSATDKTASIIFSEELGSLGNFSYDLQKPTVTYVVAAGGGTGTSRTIREGSDSGLYATYGRFETFIDTRDTTDTDEMNDRISDELENTTETSSFDFTPVELPNMMYGVDYGLGDSVTAVIEGVTLEEKVREVKRTIRASTSNNPTMSISVVVGTPNARSLRNQLNPLYDRLVRFEKRIRDLERI